ncbi:MAG: DapH/DapD/GlmU-related protein [Imperialibacter sp.]|uniref:acyltransferase n=1 Tax=Imperialibacter sp. TaxID=2038411 RepID=UPI0032EF9CD1
MSTIFKQLKPVLIKFGILPVARKLLGLILWIKNSFYHFISSCGQFYSSLKLYFFNDWLTFFPVHFIRKIYLKGVLGTEIGRQTFIHMGCRFEGEISIGNNTVIGRKCILKGEIVIKNNVSITAETYIFTSSHFVNDPDFNCFYRPVVIEDYAWIGARAMILPGVTIGKGAVLGACSVATKSVGDYKISAGMPAREIGERSKNLAYQLNYFPFFQ